MTYAGAEKADKNRAGRQSEAIELARSKLIVRAHEKRLYVGIWLPERCIDGRLVKREQVRTVFHDGLAQLQHLHFLVNEIYNNNRWDVFSMDLGARKQGQMDGGMTGTT